MSNDNNLNIIKNQTNKNNTNSNKEFIVLLNYENYISKINNSFLDYKNIYEQFTKDFGRSKYNINNINEKDIYTFIDYFEFLLCQYDLDYFEFLSLCTQAVMGSPLEILYDIINNNYSFKNEYFIGELKNLNNKLSFNYINKNKIINIIIKKYLRIFYINKNGVDKTLYYVYIKTNIPFSSKEKIIITYKILKKI